MRKLLLGLAGFAALGLGALSAEPAKAQSFSISIGSGYGGGYHRGYGGYHGGYGGHYRRAYYPRHHYYPVRRVAYPVYASPVYARPVYARPVYYGGGPRCVTRLTQRWDGWRHVTIRKRTCY
jgi:hypothetical protein